MHEERFGFLHMHSKLGHEHTRARNGSAITIWFCNMHVRTDLIMSRARPNIAQATMIAARLAWQSCGRIVQFKVVFGTMDSTGPAE